MPTDEDYDGPVRGCSCSCSELDRPEGRSCSGPICRLPQWPRCKTRQDREATPKDDSSELVGVDGSNRLLITFVCVEKETILSLFTLRDDFFAFGRCASLVVLATARQRMRGERERARRKIES